jgi:hypothetical protein
MCSSFTRRERLYVHDRYRYEWLQIVTELVSGGDIFREVATYAANRLNSLNGRKGSVADTTLRRRRARGSILRC